MLFTQRKSKTRRLNRRPRLEILEDRAVPAILTVNSLADNITDTSHLTLRDAIALVDSAGDPTSLGQASMPAGWASQIDTTSPYGTNDTIKFDSSLFAGGPQTLKMSLGQFQITKSVSINGPGASQLTLDAQKQSRIFNISTPSGLPISATEVLSGLTLTGGSPTGPIASSGQGGAIVAFATGGLTVNDCTITGNTSTTANGGGGIKFGFPLTITHSIISNNTAMGGFGGGINGNGDLTISDSTLSGNSASNGGGAISSFSPNSSLTLTNTKVTGNTAGNIGGGIDKAISGAKGVSVIGCEISGNSTTSGGGGGIFIGLSFGPVTIQNTTISGNSTTGANSPGGGLWLIQNQSTVTVQNCTISGNSATGSGSTGGGVSSDSSSALTVQSTIIAGNTAPSGLAPDLDTGGVAPAVIDHSLIGDNTNSGLAATTGTTPDANGNFVGSAASPINPLLAPLGNYGGTTQTMALLPGSLAIDHGSNPASLTTDQRDAPRVSGAGPDIGAFESKGFTLTYVSGDKQSALVGTTFPAPLVVSVASNDPIEPVAGGVVTYTGPSSGASIAANPGTATIGSNGQASLTATANGTAGTYTVTAAANGATGTAAFNLTNTATGVGLTAGGQLRIIGTPGIDIISIAQHGSVIEVNALLGLSLCHGGGTFIDQTFSAASVTSIYVDADGSINVIVIGRGVTEPVTIAHANDDIIINMSHKKPTLT